MRRTITVLSGLLLAGTTMLTAQDDQDDVHNLIIKIPEVALLDLESVGDKTINLGPEGPKEAGEALDFSNQTNSELWINYSSVIGSKSEPARDITVQITSGKLPTGILLRVKSAKDAGQGDGTMGTPNGEIELDETAQQIIGGIGTSYTGDGVAKGHQLTYALELDGKKGSYANLDYDQSTTLAITYTLTDQ
ncbi:MAG: hypothetical protein IPL46_01525 [Saprospiraceae bacterium]|nr:hypothetical protein [Saprospiraceae bacterium]